MTNPSRTINHLRCNASNIPLYICTTGCTLYLGYRVVRWIIGKCQTTNPIEQVVQNQIQTQIQTSTLVPSPSVQATIKKYVLDPAKYTLDDAVVAQAKFYLDDLQLCRSLPRAPQGNTPVYVPKELPVVLKCCGNGIAQCRFSKTMQAVTLCEQNGYKRLIVPKVQVYKHFIIEDKLPVMYSKKANIGLYVENREKFTRTAREFMGILCQASFTDLLGYDSLFSSLVPRYDNACFLFGTEDGSQVGLVGFLDLEQFTPIAGPRELQSYLDACTIAIYFFPYHLEDILDIVKEYDSTILNHREELEKSQKAVLEYFQRIYLDHAECLKNNRSHQQIQ